MNLLHKKIGIWGFGIVGKAALKQLSLQGAQPSVIDKRVLNHNEQELVAHHNAHLYSPEQLEQFLQDNDFIVPSPGIDLRAHHQHAHKFIAELDLFFLSFKAPIIAVTGTVGKTTTTSLLAHTLAVAGYRVCVGGNIGVGMLDLLAHEQPYDYAVLEVSSFQLELCKFFAPHIALWTNFYPNHLDRHGTAQQYFAAKELIAARQSATDYAIFPLELAPLLAPSLRAQKLFFSTVTTNSVGTITPASLPAHLHAVTYQQNLLAIAAALTALKIPLETLVTAAATFSVHEHRLEKVATIRGVDFYNDSKSTIPQATIAAVEKLQGRPILLLLGGLSKGVDRTTMFAHLNKSVVAIFCFGKEAETLSRAGTEQGFLCSSFDTLEAALRATMATAKAGDQILFSPAGSSFDLFSNYQERGAAFKELVTKI